MLIHNIPLENEFREKLLQNDYARLQFSQLGEDTVIWHHFHDRKNGFYVDIGCHHPFRYSNTALLSLFNGWRGINIDLDQRAIAAFEASRPQDINLQLAIGPREDELAVTLFEDGAVNSLDQATAHHQATQRPVLGQSLIKVRPLRAVLDQYLPPNTQINFMNIDAEGWDHMVLESNDWHNYRPEMIAVETHNFDICNPASNPTFQFLSQNGYRLTSHVVVTSIYQRVR